MRIFNGKKSQVVIPLVGSNQKIEVAPKSVSGDFMPNKELLSLIMTTFDYNEIALIVSGPFEISMCSQVSGCVGFVVYSLEEAIERFPSDKPAPKQAINTAILEEKKSDPVVVEKPSEPTEPKIEEEIIDNEGEDECGNDIESDKVNTPIIEEDDVPNEVVEEVARQLNKPRRGRPRGTTKKVD